jgi:hypothetical protein
VNMTLGRRFGEMQFERLGWRSDERMGERFGEWLGLAERLIERLCDMLWVMWVVKLSIWWEVV